MGSSWRETWGAGERVERMGTERWRRLRTRSSESTSVEKFENAVAALVSLCMLTRMP